MIVIPAPSPVIFELHKAGLITIEECTDLGDSSDVIRVQSDKSVEVMAQTSEVLKRHGFEEEAKTLKGKQASIDSHIFYFLVLYYTVELIVLASPYPTRINLPGQCEWRCSYYFQPLQVFFRGSEEHTSLKCTYKIPKWMQVSNGLVTITMGGEVGVVCACWHFGAVNWTTFIHV